MKVISINFVDSETIPKSVRHTQQSEAVKAILENLAKAPAGKSLIVSVEAVKKYQRYGLQKVLQKNGAKVLVSNGVNQQTGKPVLFIRRLTDKEWQEWLKG